MINVAILGFGNSAQTFHLPFLKSLPEHYKLHSILERRATPTSSKARDWLEARQWPGRENVKIVTTFEEIESDQDVALVIVTTGNDTHFEFAKRSLEAYKNVLVEKPLTPTSKEAFELALIAKTRCMVLYTYQNRRWDGDFRTVQKLIQDGTIGKIHEFESHFDRFRPVPKGGWRETAGVGSGMLYDLGAHVIDQAVVLFGAPASVTAFVHKARDQEVDDSFTLTLHYPADGADRPYPLEAILRASILSATFPPLRFSIKGTKGSYTKKGLDLQEAQLKKAMGPGDKGYGQELVEGSGPGGEREWGWVETAEGEGNADSGKVERLPTLDGDYQSLYINLANAIIGTEDPAVTPEQVALALKIIEAAQVSSDERRTVDLVYDA